MFLTRRNTLALALGLAVGRSPDSLAETNAKLQPVSPNAPWTEIARLAQEFVSKESPHTVWPFEKASPSALQNAKRKVLIHYFPFFQLSFDNLEHNKDHWSEFTNRDGVGGRFNDIGGYTRERPLTPAPWTSPYWRQINAAVDVLRAKLIGADGFGVDMPQLGASKRADQLRILCEAAEAVAPGFTIALEPGMAALKNVSAADLADELAYLSTCVAVNRVDNGRLLVIPFAADLQDVSFWTEVIDRLNQNGVKIAFVPDLLDFYGNAEKFRAIRYGETLWGARDPVEASSDRLRAIENRVRSEVSTWMQPVVAQDVRPKSSIFWEASNTTLFRTLWMQAINDSAPYVHALTWNDYGESTELQPSSCTQFLFYDLFAFYAQWFKLGTPPTVTKDAIYYCHRNHIYMDEEQPQRTDKIFKRMGSTGVQNDVELIVLLTAPASVEIEISGQSSQKIVSAGLSTMRVAAQIGRPVFRVIRHGTVVLEKISDWDITNHSLIANPLYFGGSSTRPLTVTQDNR